MNLHTPFSTTSANTLNRTITQGLLRSNNIVQYASDIPCNIIQTLETDADQAQQFVQQIEAGQVPAIIQDLPSEVISAFSDILGIFVTLPTQLIGAAEAAITEAANLFNDIETGAIVSDIENIPGIVVSDVTSAWGDLTSGLEGDWTAATSAIACFFDSCPVTTSAADACGSSTAVESSIAVKASSTGQPASASSASGPSNPNVVSKAAGGNSFIDVFGGTGFIDFWPCALSVGVGLTLWL